MKCVHNIKKTAFMFIVLVSFFGCNSKKDKIESSAGPAQDKAGASAASTKDKADASTAAARVYSLMKSGDFSTIYKESAPSFKKFGTESAFIAKMQQVRQTTGALKSVKEIGYVSEPDAVLGSKHVIISTVQYDKPLTENLIFARSKNGKMELCIIDQESASK
jgi:hypothetical protein